LGVLYIVNPNLTAVKRRRLVHAVLRERAIAVKDLLEEYVPRLYRFALRLTGNRDDAEDLTQAALLRAWKDRARLRDPGAAKSWLFAIAANLWRSGLRRMGREERLADNAEQFARRQVALPEEEIIIREDMIRVRETMDALPDRQREVLYLHACEAFSLPEIAEILALSPQAVKASLSLARKRMRQKLKDLNCVVNVSRVRETHRE
jgi:RNA polymerase sigma-70 factor, ECF subfamily